MKQRRIAEPRLTIEQAQLLTHAQVCRLLGVTSNTLYNWRCARRGPTFLKLGRYVRYRLRDVIEWQTTRLDEVPTLNF